MIPGSHKIKGATTEEAFSVGERSFGCFGLSVSFSIFYMHKNLYNTLKETEKSKKKKNLLQVVLTVYGPTQCLF